MVHRCIVCGSKQGSNPHLSFHRFPRNEKLRKQWLQACSLNENDIKTRTIVCSHHFVLDEDFDELFWPRRKLKSNAVPSPSLNHQKTNNNNSLSVTKRPNAIIYPQNTENSNREDETICNNESNVEHSKTDDNNERETIDILRVENLEIPEESPYVVIIENSPPSPKSGSPPPKSGTPINTEDTNMIESSANSPPLCTGNLTEPRYFGDLKAEHFSTPEKSKKYIAFINGIFNQNRRRIRQLTRENSRLICRLKHCQALLDDLRQNKVVSEDIIKKFNVRRFFSKRCPKKQHTGFVGEQHEEEDGIED